METIFVALLGEAEESWRPVQAAPRAGGLYLILSKNDDPESEHWQFSSGSLVRCEPRLVHGHMHPVAVELMRPQGLRLVK